MSLRAYIKDASHGGGGATGEREMNVGSARCVAGLIFNTPVGDYFLRRAVIYTGLKKRVAKYA